MHAENGKTGCWLFHERLSRERRHMRNYVEIDGVLYKKHLYDDEDGGLKVPHIGYIRSRRKNYKNSLRYKLWYHMPEIIDIGYQITFAISGIAAAIMTAVSFYAMYNVLI